MKEVGGLALIGLFNGLCVTRLNMLAFVPTLSLNRLRKHPGKD
jgi:ribose/xylose/arabinose/galactoside ABC-type transport system permease subunit